MVLIAKMISYLMDLVAPVFNPKSGHHPIRQAAVSVFSVQPNLHLHHVGDVAILLFHPNYNHINITIPANIYSVRINSNGKNYLWSTICWVVMPVISTFSIWSTSIPTFCLITSLHSVST